MASTKEKERQLSKRNKSLSAQLKGEQEDCRRLRLQMQHKDVQYAHEMRKRDRESGRLKDRLGQVRREGERELLLVTCFADVAVSVGTGQEPRTETGN